MNDLKDTFAGRKARTAKEVSDAFRAESSENERLYQEADARHAADESKATLDVVQELEAAHGTEHTEELMQRAADEIKCLRLDKLHLQKCPGFTETRAAMGWSREVCSNEAHVR